MGGRSVDYLAQATASWWSTAREEFESRAVDGCVGGYAELMCGVMIRWWVVGKGVMVDGAYVGLRLC